MATTIAVSAPLHRLTVDEVMAMGAAGVLGEDTPRLELVDGVLVEVDWARRPTPEHSFAVQVLNRHFVKAAPEGLEVRVQDTLVLGPRDYRVPDLVVFEPVARTEMLTFALLVVEVAQTSQVRDAEKAFEYASIGVPEYWIVDLPAAEVRVHREPGVVGYRQIATRDDGDLIPLLDGVPAVSVASLFGR